MKVYYCFPGGKYKALTMSYDDGKLADARLVEIFNRYGIKGTFNLNAGMYGQIPGDRLPWERIPELYKGHEVASHAYTHPTLARCPLVGVAGEIMKDRMALEAVTGGTVRGLAYPNGSWSEDIKGLLKSLGIAYGRVAATRADFELPKDPYEWYPTCHHDDPQLMEKARWFANFKKKWYLKLMFVWGHSYEFSNDGTWEIIEGFCEFIGGREDIWYATNIQIIDYMEVLNRLQFTASGEAVFNPSAQSAWLEIDDERILEVPGGEFVNLKGDQKQWLK